MYRTISVGYKCVAPHLFTVSAVQREAHFGLRHDLAHTFVEAVYYRREIELLPRAIERAVGKEGGAGKAVVTVVNTGRRKLSDRSKAVERGSDLGKQEAFAAGVDEAKSVFVGF